VWLPGASIGGEDLTAKYASFDKLRMIGVYFMLATIFPFALSLSKGSVRNFQEVRNML
jgi:hypothetical protein